jgi:hypothetical protein
MNGTAALNPSGGVMADGNCDRSTGTITSGMGYLAARRAGQDVLR